MSTFQHNALATKEGRESKPKRREKVMHCQQGVRIEEKRSSEVYKFINDPRSVGSILSNAQTSSYFILSFAFICLSIIFHSLTPPESLCFYLTTLSFLCQNLPMLLSLNFILLLSPFSSLFWGLQLSHLCPCQTWQPSAAISLCYRERSRLYKDQ